MKAIDMLNAAAGHMKQRAGTYDQPDGERSMRRTVAAFNAVKGREVLTESDGWLLMELLKLARDQSRDTPHQDSLEDAVAYAALYGEARMAGSAAPGTRAQFEAVRNRAMLGDPSAVEDLQSASESFLEASRGICSGDVWDGQMVKAGTIDANLVRVCCDGIVAGSPTPGGRIDWCNEETPLDDSWVRHTGKCCPVSPGTAVNVRLLGCFGFGIGEPRDFTWVYDPPYRGVVVAYRIVRAAEPAADADGWIEWGGGDCPVPPDTVVEVRLRNGDVRGPLLASDCRRWGSGNGDLTVVAYRIVRAGGAK